MARVRRPWILLVVLVCSLVLSAGSAVAKGPKKNPRLTWTPERIVQTVNPGQSVQLSASFTSAVELQNVTLNISGGLGKIVQISPSSIASLKAGEVATVTLTVTLPAKAAHTQSGVLKVKAGKKNLPGSLKIQIKVPGTDEDK